MPRRDLRDYKVRSTSEPTQIELPRPRRLRHGAVVVSGGTTVGEALNILERYDLSAMTPTQALHHYLEASALAFADRGKYVGDPAFVDVPTKRSSTTGSPPSAPARINPTQAATKPVRGRRRDVVRRRVRPPRRRRRARPTPTPRTSRPPTSRSPTSGATSSSTPSPSSRPAARAWSCPGDGFLLNNELTDFSTVYDAADPNRIQPGKRPRSSMSPTIVLKDGKPFLALGSPGGSTIITTVLQMLVNRHRPRHDDRGGDRGAARLAAQHRQRDRRAGLHRPYGAGLTALGHTLDPSGDAFTSAAEIGAATAIEFGPRRPDDRGGRAEPRGKGSARWSTPASCPSGWDTSSRELPLPQGPRHGERLRACCPTPTAPSTAT